MNFFYYRHKVSAKCEISNEEQIKMQTYNLEDVEMDSTDDDSSSEEEDIQSRNKRKLEPKDFSENQSEHVKIIEMYQDKIYAANGVSKTEQHDMNNSYLVSLFNYFLLVFFMLFILFCLHVCTLVWYL